LAADSDEPAQRAPADWAAEKNSKPLIEIASVEFVGRRRNRRYAWIFNAFRIVTSSTPPAR